MFDTMVSSYLHNSQERSYALQNFASRDAQGVLDLYNKHKAQLKDEGMDKLYQEIGCPSPLCCMTWRPWARWTRRCWSAWE